MSGHQTWTHTRPNVKAAAPRPPPPRAVWMTPAAWGAFMPFRSVQHFTSSVPAVKK